MDFPPLPSPPANGAPSQAIVRCKPKHHSLTKSGSGNTRTKVDLKSRCPGWITQQIQQRLVDDALVDPSGDTDSFGRPRKIWNAVAGWTFIGVSSNEQVAAYNCYPEVPVTALAEELMNRAERRIEDVLGGTNP